MVPAPLAGLLLDLIRINAAAAWLVDAGTKF